MATMSLSFSFTTLLSSLWFTLLLSLLITTVTRVEAASILPTVDLGYAVYSANPLPPTLGFINFNGIKYAEAERFGEPQTPATNRNIQAAIDQTTVCAQGDSRIEIVYLGRQKEDCLMLDVYTPSMTPSSPLPVIFYIHGGSYTLTSRNDFGPSVFARNTDLPFIFVAINYRLGAFGFLAGKDYKGTLNAGLRDQNVALHWVQKHIAKFGGDPNNVILTGESAGAGAVLQQAVSPYGKGLFHRIWTSSIFLPPQPTATSVTSNLYYNQLVDAAKCQKGNADATYSCLKALSTSDFQTATYAVMAEHHKAWPQFLPVVDGDFIPADPFSLMAAKQVHGVEVLGGSNVNEGAMFLPASNITTPTQVEEWVQVLWTGFSVSQRKELYSLYPSPTVNTTYTNEAGRLAAMIGDGIFRCVANAFVEAYPTSYRYEFAVNPSQHGQDLVYLFERATLYYLQFGLPEPEVQRDLVSKVMAYLLSNFFPSEGLFTSSKKQSLSISSKKQVLIDDNVNGVILKTEILSSGVKETTVSATYTENGKDVCPFWISSFPNFVS